MAEGFKLIQVGDDSEEELVIHAGGGPAGRPVSPQPIAEDAGDGAASTQQADGQDPGGAADAKAHAGESEAHARLRRRADELEEAESNLQKTKRSRMQVYVLIALALLMVAFFAYTMTMQ